MRSICSCRARILPVIIPLLLAGGIAGSAVAQLGGRATIISGGTLLLPEGQRIEKGELLIMGAQIAGIGEKVDAPPFPAPKKVSAKGKYLSAGLVDVWSTLGMRGGSAGGRATTSARDGFDRYDVDAIRAAWAAGVTVAYVPARANVGIGGAGVALRLKQDASLDDMVLAENGVLHASIDAFGNQGPLARLRAVRDLRRALEDAKDYRQAREDYDEELKEYEKKIAERAKKAVESEKDAGKEQKEGQPTAANTEPRPRPRPDRPRPQDAPKPPDPSKPADAPKEGEKKDEIKKPVEPAKDRNKDTLLKVLDGEMRLRVEAQRPEDLLSLLEMARDLNIALTIDGAAAAGLVADEMHAQSVAVILGPRTGTMLFDPGPDRWYSADTFANLRAAGVSAYLGSGPTAEFSMPNLALRAAECVRDDFTTNQALDLITVDAARFLGIEKKAGKLATGMPADIVIWSNHPLAAGARVEHVFVAGEEVYKAPKLPAAKSPKAAAEEPAEKSDGEE